MRYPINLTLDISKDFNKNNYIYWIKVYIINNSNFNDKKNFNIFDFYNKFDLNNILNKNFNFYRTNSYNVFEIFKNYLLVLDKSSIENNNFLNFFNINFLRKERSYTKLKYSRVPSFDIVSGGSAALFAGFLGFLGGEKFGFELPDSGDFYYLLMYVVFLCFILKVFLKIVDDSYYNWSFFSLKWAFNFYSIFLNYFFYRIFINFFFFYWMNFKYYLKILNIFKL